MAKYELKVCPKCNSEFECKPCNITNCQCYEIVLSNEKGEYIANKWKDCLCIDCLKNISYENINHKKSN
jgi:hypothetical protein